MSPTQTRFSSPVSHHDRVDRSTIGDRAAVTLLL